MTKQIETVKSADRVIDILELLSEHPRGLAFSDISAALGIPKSSLFPLLRNLVNRGYVAQREAAGAYHLGKQVRYLAAKLQAPPLLSVVAPFVEAAARDLNETSAFYVRRQAQARVGVAVDGDQPLRSTLRAGDEAPLHVSSGGRAILSATRSDHRDAYLQYISPLAITPKTKLDPAEIRQAIDAAAESGFAYDLEECTLGVVGVARAVCYGGAPAGALGFVIPTVRFSDGYQLRICRVLRTTVVAIEAALNEAGFMPGFQ